MDYVLSTIYVVLLLLLYLRDRRREREIKEFRERIEIFDAFITKVLYDVINMRSKMEEDAEERKERHEI